MRNDSIKIKGDKVNLIPASLYDKQKVYEWCFHSETTKSHSGPPDYPENPIATYEEFYESYRDYFFTGSNPEGGRQFFIVNDGEPIGCISYTAYHLKQGIAELDNWISSEANCGKGFGTDAIVALSNYLNETLGIHTVIMGPSSRNTRAIRAYEKAGLKKTDLSMNEFLLDEYIALYGDGDYGKDDTVVCVKRFNQLPRKRCSWADGDEKMAKYHDEVWGKPEHDDQKLFAKLCLDLMQAGLMWRTILHKQENFLDAFDGFHIETVAGYDEAKYEELMQNAGIVRNRLKIRAIINNAACVIEIQKEFGSFDAYIWRFTKGKTVKNAWKHVEEVPTSTTLSDAISNDMKKRGFRFVGTTIIYAFLQAAGVVNDHLTDCFCYERESEGFDI